MSNIICHKSKSAYGRSALGLDSRWLRHREPQLISRCPAREELLASHMVSVGSPVPVDNSVGTRLSTAHTPTRTVCPLQSHLLFPINKWSPRSGLTTQNTAWERDIKQLLAALNVTEEALSRRAHHKWTLQKQKRSLSAQGGKWTERRANTNNRWSH